MTTQFTLADQPGHIDRSDVYDVERYAIRGIGDHLQHTRQCGTCGDLVRERDRLKAKNKKLRKRLKRATG